MYFAIFTSNIWSYLLWSPVIGGIGETSQEVYGGLSEGVAMKRYLHGPMDFAKELKLRFRVGDLGLTERKKRYTSSRKGEEVDAGVPLWQSDRE